MIIEDIYRVTSDNANVCIYCEDEHHDYYLEFSGLVQDIPQKLYLQRVLNMNVGYTNNEPYLLIIF